MLPHYVLDRLLTSFTASRRCAGSSKAGRGQVNDCVDQPQRCTSHCCRHLGRLSDRDAGACVNQAIPEFMYYLLYRASRSRVFIVRFLCFWSLARLWTLQGVVPAAYLHTCILNAKNLFCLVVSLCTCDHFSIVRYMQIYQLQISLAAVGKKKRKNNERRSSQ